MVRAKFVVRRIERDEQAIWDKNVGKYVFKEVQTIVLMPVTGESCGENEQFFASTPNGEIKLGTVNADAAAMFELGNAYYVDFSPATRAEENWVATENSGDAKRVSWRSLFDDRQLKEIEFALLYARQFRHGTEGHNAKLIIAKMAELLDGQIKAPYVSVDPNTQIKAIRKSELKSR